MNMNLAPSVSSGRDYLLLRASPTEGALGSYSLSGARAWGAACGTLSLDAWVVGKEAVSGSVRKLKTEYLSRFTLGKPTKVELGVKKETQDILFQEQLPGCNPLPIKFSPHIFHQLFYLPERSLRYFDFPKQFRTSQWFIWGPPSLFLLQWGLGCKSEKQIYTKEKFPCEKCTCSSATKPLNELYIISRSVYDDIQKCRTFIKRISKHWGNVFKVSYVKRLQTKDKSEFYISHME